MARLDQMPEPMRSHIAKLPCPSFETTPWVEGPALQQARVAIISRQPDFTDGQTARLRERRAIIGSFPSISLPVALRLAAHDHKAFYFEAAIARPGSSVPDSAAFNRWFWKETAAGQVINLVRKKCLSETDRSLRLVGSLLLVPMNET